MKAVQIQTIGGPEVLQVVDLPLPEPGPGQVRVKAEAIGVGMPDVLIRKGAYKWMPPMPAVLGNEMAGTVDVIGPGVTSLRVGQRVFVSARELPHRGGCYTEAICVAESAPFPLPDSIDFEAAVCLGNFQLALALLSSAGSPSARSVLVSGAAGGVGSALVQVARARGLQVIGTALTPEKRDIALANGANAVVDSEAGGLARAVLELTGDLGVDLVIDQVGGDVLIACLHALAPFGTAVSYSTIAGAPSSDVFAELGKLRAKSLAVRVFSIHTVDADAKYRRGLMENALAMLAEGRIRVPTITSFPLADARRAHEFLESGEAPGKVVLRRSAEV